MAYGMKVKPSLNLRQNALRKEVKIGNHF